MSDTLIIEKHPRRKKLLRLVVILLALVVILYLVISSTVFLKSVILPQISKSMGANVTVADANIRPLSGIELQKLKVEKSGTEPLLSADQVVLRYNLIDIVRGKINVNELTLVSPVITIVESPGGKDNLPELGKPSAPAESTKTAPAQIDIKNVSIKNGTVSQIKKNRNGRQETTELRNINLALDRLKNGASGKLELSGDVKLDSNASDVLQGAISTKIDYALAQNLLPQNAKGSGQFDVKNATGIFKDLPGLKAALNCDLTPGEIKKLALEFNQAGENLGEVRVSGPFDAAKVEGKLKVDISSMNRKVLNVLAAAKGIDFGSTEINSSNVVDLFKGGQAVAVEGQVRADSFSITQAGQATPKTDLSAQYDLLLDRASGNALIKTFTLNGTQNNKKLLSGSLSKPMKLDWSKSGSAVDESAFELTVNDLSLADWRAFAEDLEPSGSVDMKLVVFSHQAGSKIKFGISSKITDFSGILGNNRIEHADINLTARGELNEFNALDLTESQMEIAHQKQGAAIGTISGQYFIKSGDADFKTTLTASLPKAFQLLEQPDLQASSGTLTFSGNIKQSGDIQAVNGNLSLANFTGQYGDNRFENFGAALETDVEKRGDLAEIRKLGGELKQGPASGGNFGLTGTYNFKKQSGQMDLKLSGLNQNGVRPFFSAILKDKRLVSVSINGSAVAKMEGDDRSTVKADFNLANLVVHDPKKREADAPLTARFQMDTAMEKQVWDVRQLQLGLSPTDRAKNQIQAKGRLDLSRTNVIQGKLNIIADSVDITPYYDLYSSPQPSETEGTQQASQAMKAEPASAKSPFKGFSFEANIGKFFLREIQASEIQMVGKFDDEIVFNPVQFTLNGAPVKAVASLNLNVPGYSYSFSFSADKVPLEPIANSFMPDKRGQYQGDIIAWGEIKGRGTTGTQLRQYLTGNAGLTLTNANIQIVGPKMRKVVVPVSVALGIPELAQAPIKWSNVEVLLGSGAINITRCDLASDAFRGHVQGSVPIADVLTNSPVNLPVTVELQRVLAEKAPNELNLIPAGTPEDVQYFQLPQFVTLIGTLGDISPKIDTSPLLMKAGAGLIQKQIERGKIGGDVGKVLKGVFGGGQPPAPDATTNAQPNNNQSPTNRTPPAINLLDLFKKPKK